LHAAHLVGGAHAASQPGAPGGCRICRARETKRFADNDPVVRQQVTLPNVIAVPGGLPIRVGDDDVIGGAAVSGSPWVDEPCVQAGLDKIAERLLQSAGISSPIPALGEIPTVIDGMRPRKSVR
jgi:hypothetical protein